MSVGDHFLLVWRWENSKDNFSRMCNYLRNLYLKNRTSLIRIGKKISDFINFGVKWSPMIRLDQKKKTLGQNIDPSENYGQNKIIIFLIYRVPLMNLDILRIHLSITFDRINVLTQSFFCWSSLIMRLHLTPKLIHSENFFGGSYQAGPIF